MTDMEWEVRGHEWAARLLGWHIRRGEVRHAYLFAGPPGVGRRTLALRFAQALNCTRPPEPGRPCLECQNCRQIERMQHIDLSVTQADKEGGPLKVEQVREMQSTLSLLPRLAAYRVALLLRFEEANPNAQNALLKTLEEAPSRAVLLLTTDAPDNLLPTIVSRCEVLRLRPLPLDRLSAELQARGAPAGEARLLAHLSGGRLGAALRLRGSPPLLEQRGEWVDQMFSLLQQPLRKRFEWAEKAADQRRREKGKEDLRAAFRIWLGVWRDVLRAAADPALDPVNLDRRETILTLAGQVGVQGAREQTAALEQALDRLDANVNARLLAETLLMGWPMLPAP